MGESAVTFGTARTEEEIWELPPLMPEQVRQLPATFGLAYAGRAWGLSKSRAHHLARTGEFPCAVTKLGPRGYRVRRADLMESLGIKDEPAAGAQAPADPAA